MGTTTCVEAAARVSDAAAAVATRRGAGSDVNR